MKSPNVWGFALPGHGSCTGVQFRCSTSYCIIQHPFISKRNLQVRKKASSPSKIFDQGINLSSSHVQPLETPLLFPQWKQLFRPFSLVVECPDWFTLIVASAGRQCRYGKSSNSNCRSWTSLSNDSNSVCWLNSLNKEAVSDAACTETPINEFASGFAAQ